MSYIKISISEFNPVEVQKLSSMYSEVGLNQSLPDDSPLKFVKLNLSVTSILRNGK